MVVQLVSKISNLCDPDPPTLQTDRQTDGRTTCNLNTALCTSASRGKSITKHCSHKWEESQVAALEVEHSLHKRALYASLGRSNAITSVPSHVTAAPGSADPESGFTPTSDNTDDIRFVVQTAQSILLNSHLSEPCSQNDLSL